MASRDGTATVLVVEDNRDDAALIKNALERCSARCRIEIVGDGIEGLDYLFSEGTYARGGATSAPALILLDLDLPGMDGHEFLRRIRAADETKLIPVVVVTVSAEEYDTVNAYDLGANGYVVKPLDGGGFIEKITAAADYWLNINEGPAGSAH